MFTKGNVTKTIYLSLFVQIVTSLVSLDGVDIHLDKNNLVLQDILKLELFVQLVEGIFSFGSATIFNGKRGIFFISNL